jgi:hypothetical protein
MRTGRPCSTLSFQDIASGSLPEFSLASRPTHPEPEPGRSASGQGSGEIDGNEDSGSNPDSSPTIDMVICSFALHLLEDSSQLWALLSELSWKATWLIVLEPHKKPEVSTHLFFHLRSSYRANWERQIKDGWGWTQWNFYEWKDSMGAQRKGIEILEDRYEPPALVQQLPLIFHIREYIVAFTEV